jgi:signal-transduction protein with cAMP-binding, CBS, and nucleotidyltransferase domain
MMLCEKILKFFKKFILEEEGQNKDKFDIKTRAIMPLVDGAHLLVLSSEIKRSIIPMLDLSNLRLPI